MKKTLRSIAAAALVVVSLSFTHPENKGLNITYGVSESDPSRIELSLTEDFKFTYQDFSNPNRSIEVKGTYTLKNGKVVLMADQGDARFHDRWKLSHDRMKAKARKGLAFYTLCRVE